MSERGFLNRRRAPRTHLAMPASVVTMSAYQYFELVDLSATGAKLRGDTVPALGKSALFRLDGYQTLCKAVWAEAGQCGVRFDEIIPPPVLAQLRKAGTGANVGLRTSDEFQAIAS